MKEGGERHGKNVFYLYVAIRGHEFPGVKAIVTFKRAPQLPCRKRQREADHHYNMRIKISIRRLAHIRFLRKLKGKNSKRKKLNLI